MPGIQGSTVAHVPTVEQAAAALRRIQEKCGAKAAGLESLSKLLADPLFQQLLNLENALEKVKNEIRTNPTEFPDYTLDSSGRLIDLNPEQTESDSEDDSTDHDIHDDGTFSTLIFLLTPSVEWLNEFIDKMANGREVEHITLEKQQDSSLGFSVVGLESDNRGELGIFVQDIQPGTVADVDGRLKESDQILVINGKPLGLNVSHTEAIAALQAVKDVVQLVVARGPIPRQITTISRTPSSASSFQLKPTEKRWAHRETIELRKIDGKGFGFGIVGGKATGVLIKTILPGGPAELDGRLQSGDTILFINGTDLNGMGSEQAASILQSTGGEVELEIARGELPHFDQVGQDPAQEEVYEVELSKDESGIGIHIAGYVDGNAGGIHVKAITPDSPASRDGRIREGDQIIAVNGLKLDGPNVGSEEAVMALQNTGDTVHLTLSRRQKQKTPQVTNEELDRLREFWAKTMSGVGDFDIIIAQVRKEHPSEPLGFDVEGIIDELGRTQHIIRKVAMGGPVAQSGHVRPGDRLLEANGQALLHMDQGETISCLKGLPQDVLFVLARETEDKNDTTPAPQPPPPQLVVQSANQKLVPETEDSDNDSDISLEKLEPDVEEIKKQETASLTQSVINRELHQIEKDISIEPEEAIASSSSSDESDDERIVKLKSQLHWIDLEKGSNGLGFSILDTNGEHGHHVKIRGLVKSGVAEQQGELKAEDLLIFVNEFHFDMERFTLQDCVAMLKSLPPGPVKLGVMRPFNDEEPASMADDIMAEIKSKNGEVDQSNQSFKASRKFAEQIAPIIQTPRQLVSCAGVFIYSRSGVTNQTNIIHLFCTTHIKAICSITELVRF